MYNRYIRNDQGGYTRVPHPDQSQHQPKGPAEKRSQLQQPSTPTSAPPPHSQHPPQNPERNFFNQLLKSLHLGDLDSGDLLLLLILFLLFREKADEELLIAIGLLLIL